MSSDISIRSDIRPGDLGRMIALHGVLYADDPSHFGPLFEAYLAKTVAEFMFENEGRGRIFLAERSEELVGCSALIERAGERGQLRWVLTAPAARGLGLGKTLVLRAIAYARERGMREVYLETTAGLAASMAIYERLGFKETGRERGSPWGAPIESISMSLSL